MTHLFWLSDDAWAAFEPHLPQGKPGKPRVDDRRVISGHPFSEVSGLVTRTQRRLRSITRSLAPFATTLITAAEGEGPSRRLTKTEGTIQFAWTLAIVVLPGRLGSDCTGFSSAFFALRARSCQV